MSTARRAAAGAAPLSLVWFRQDLRLADNPALRAAAQRGPLVPLYIESFAEDGAWPPGAASRWWLHQSLAALDCALRARGVRLILRRGPALAVLRELISELGADAVFWNRRYEPAALARDRHLKLALRADGVIAESANGALLAEPWDLANQRQRPFQVFTPFWRALLRLPAPLAPAPAPRHLAAPPRWPASLTLDALGLQPSRPWYPQIAASWQPGEAAAGKRLKGFVPAGLGAYGERRDRPDLPGTSGLSAHLHFGEISPRQIWHALAQHAARRAGASRAWQTDKFMAELIWREFAHHLLYHFPHTPQAPLRREFERFAWREDPPGLHAWQQGRTGVPLVDAGMRQLWATGWMHNRVRMVCASYLVKNLRLPWQAGARWFWDTLVDADLANNTLGWQWSAGCGADAAPYFRIFNAETQARKFDPNGEYRRRWVPEAGTDAYVAPIVDPRASRQAALEAYARLRQQR